jgi:hypothetical protein
MPEWWFNSVPHEYDCECWNGKCERNRSPYWPSTCLQELRKAMDTLGQTAGLGFRTCITDPETYSYTYSLQFPPHIAEWLLWKIQYLWRARNSKAWSFAASEGIAPSILNFSTRWRTAVSVTVWPTPCFVWMSSWYWGRRALLIKQFLTMFCVKSKVCTVCAYQKLWAKQIHLVPPNWIPIQI